MGSAVPGALRNHKRSPSLVNDLIFSPSLLVNPTRGGCIRHPRSREEERLSAMISSGSPPVPRSSLDSGILHTYPSSPFGYRRLRTPSIEASTFWGILGYVHRTPDICLALFFPVDPSLRLFRKRVGLIQPPLDGVNCSANLIPETVGIDPPKSGGHQSQRSRPRFQREIQVDLNPNPNPNPSLWWAQENMCN